MRIVFIHTDFRAYWSARLKFISERFANSGDELIVVEIAGKGSYYKFEEHSANENIDNYHCLFPNLGIEEVDFELAFNKTYKKLSELKPEIVFSGAFPYTSGAASLNWCRDNKVPLVIFDNARLCDVPRTKTKNFLKKRMFLNTDAVFIPAPSHDYDYKFWGMKKEKIFYGLNVVDNKMWHELIPGREVLKKFKNDKNLPDRFILGVGRQVPKKNWLKLIEAFIKENNSKELPFSMVLVGNGPQRKELAGFIEKKNITKVKLFDFQQPRELAKFYALADAVVLPSFYGETWGLVINEAMASAKPVLVSKQCGCCKTLVVEGKTGYSFDPNSKEEIRAAIRKVAGMSSAELDQMGKNAQNLIANWGLERFENGMREAIAEVTKKPARGFRNIMDKVIIRSWKGHYRPT